MTITNAMTSLLSHQVEDQQSSSPQKDAWEEERSSDVVHSNSPPPPHDEDNHPQSSSSPTTQKENEEKDKGTNSISISVPEFSGQNSFIIIDNTNKTSPPPCRPGSPPWNFEVRNFLSGKKKKEEIDFTGYEQQDNRKMGGGESKEGEREGEGEKEKEREKKQREWEKEEMDGEQEGEQEEEDFRNFFKNSGELKEGERESEKEKGKEKEPEKKSWSLSRLFSSGSQSVSPQHNFSECENIVLERCSWRFAKSYLGNLYNDPDNIGVVDYVWFDVRKGVAMTADTVGHRWKGEHKMKIKSRLNELWKDHYQQLAGESDIEEDVERSWDEVEILERRRLLELSQQFEKIGTSSTYSSLSLVKYRAFVRRKFFSTKNVWGDAVLSVQVGDSGVIRFFREHDTWKCEAITEFITGNVRHCELSGDVRKADIRLIPVNKDDVLVGATDGIWDTILGSEKLTNLAEIFKGDLDDPTYLTEKMFNLANTIAREKNVKENKLDDVALFAVQI